ncbi:hypothetical protein RB593_006082 [Gaeumannomyces tritici]
MGDGGAGNTLRTAIIAPPDVFGLAPGAKRRTPLLLGYVVDVARRVGPGDNILAPKAYCFIETQELTWRELMGDMVVPALKRHGDEAFAAWDQGQFEVISLEEVKSHIMARFGGLEGAKVWSGHVAENMAVTMRTRGSRAAALFGLRPEDATLDIERDVKALLGVV